MDVQYCVKTQVFSHVGGHNICPASSLIYPWLLKMMADQISIAPSVIFSATLLAVLLAMLFLLSVIAGYAAQVSTQEFGFTLHPFLFQTQ